MSESVVPAEIHEFLGESTPGAWLDAALGNVGMLINDHANCEKKAAATAMSMMFRYADRAALARRMSQLAREELRHFEQVQTLMRDEGIAWQRVSASRYAARLHEGVSGGEPDRLIDQLIVGAFIEARSCERFALVAPAIGEPFTDFYRGLLAAEARHFRVYLDLAVDVARQAEKLPIDHRIENLRSIENRLISTPDDLVRFHSGLPAVEDPSAVVAGT